MGKHEGIEEPASGAVVGGPRTVQQVQKWRDELLDLTKRNRLLNLPLGPRSALIRITEPGLDRILSVLTSDKAGAAWRFHYPPLSEEEDADQALRAAMAVEDPDLTEDLQLDELLTNVDSARKLSNRLHTLERKASAEFIDKGVRVLYLGAGILHWVDGSDQMASPLVMIPVELTRQNPNEPFRLLPTEDDPVVNPALALKLETDLGITLPNADDCSSVMDAVAKATAAVIGRSGWTVDDDAVLGAFSFHKDAMYRDLKANEAAIVAHPLVAALSGDSAVAEQFPFDPIPADQLDVVAPPESMASILDADSTQRQCIVAARDGRSFVMDGPPGTGKSQTIANIIAELLAAGRTVLFVSEKAAALDVVKNRLDRAGLGSYVLELHSHKATRKEVAAALGRALTERPRTATERDGSHVEEVRRVRESLSAFADAQNEVRTPFGRSLHWAIGRRSQLTPSPGTPIPDGVTVDLSATAFAQIVALATTLAATWASIADRDAFLWSDLRAPEEAQQRLSAIQVEVRQAKDKLAAVGSAVSEASDALLVPPPLTLDDATGLASLVATAADRPLIPAAWLSTGDHQGIIRRIGELEGMEAVRRERANALAPFEPIAPDFDRTIHNAIDAALNSAAGMDPPLPVTLTDSTERFSTQAEFLAWVTAETPALQTDADRLADVLGLPRHQHPGLLHQLGRLGALAAEPVRPEPWWFDRAVLEEANATIGTLKPIVEQYRRLREQLLSVFNEQVFVFDIEGLYDGPTDLVPKLGRLSGRGRTNRKQLQATVQSGSISDEALSLLPMARQWRIVATDLQNVSARSAETLGSHYFRSAETDVDQLHRALEIARQAIDLAQTAGMSEALRTNLSRESADGARIGAQGRAFATRLNNWMAVLRRELGPSAEPLLGRPLADIVTWATEGKQVVEALQALLVRAGTHAHGEAVATVGDARTISVNQADIDTIDGQLAASAEPDRELLGRGYVGLGSDWDALQAGLAWVQDVQRQLGGPALPSQARELLEAVLRPGDLDHAVSEYRKAVSAIEDLFTPQRASEMRRELEGFADAEELLTQLDENIGQIDQWATHVKTVDLLIEAGVGPVVDHLKAGSVEAETVAPSLEWAVLTGWIDRVLGSDPRCQPVLAAERDQLVDRFRVLDRELVAFGAAKAIAAGNARRPSASIGEAAIIKREAEKKTRHRPIRTLLAEAGQVAQQLKPCFMMSPLSVSQYLPSDLRFDAVVFDEASQVKPSDAVNAVYRGNQLIVAGDNRQLPPSSFFDRMSDDGGDEYDEEQLDTFESVLDLCRGSAGISELPLRWHYRSRHESLITYSNRAFYNSSLVTYPSSAEEALDLGVAFFHVPDGVYQRGASRDNPIEARRVVERVIHHAEHHPTLTCGVVAFSEAQAVCIERELELVRRERRDLDRYFHADRLDGFFIKNLENVQGDERDIIIFSIGYGHDENGKFTMNFGPINGPAGQRRLNVAVTRAKRRVEVVSSVHAQDIRETASDGVRHLKGYLDYAERGLAALAPIDAESDGDVESPFEESVLGVLRSWGYDVVPQVGQAGYRIDLGIRDPDDPTRFLLAVECDGAAYHSSPAARDRDRLRQEVLEGLGWTMHRIWGPSWYRGQAVEEQRLRDAIARAHAGEDAPETGLVNAAPTIGHVPIEVDLVDLDGPPEWVVRWKPTDFPRNSARRSIADPRSRSLLLDDLLLIVTTEGPVMLEICVERLRTGWNVPRMTAAVRAVVDEALRELTRQGRVLETEPGCFTVPNQPSDMVRAPAPFQEGRKAGQVPPPELRSALRRCAVDAVRVDSEELLTRVTRIFGWSRRGSDINAALTKALDQLLVSGDLKRDVTGMITVPGGR